MMEHSLSNDCGFRKHTKYIQRASVSFVQVYLISCVKMDEIFFSLLLVCGCKEVLHVEIMAPAPINFLSSCLLFS